MSVEAIRALARAAREEVAQSTYTRASQVQPGSAVLAIASLAAHLRQNQPGQQRIRTLGASALARLARIVAVEAEAPALHALDTLRLVQESRFGQGVGSVGCTWRLREPRELLIAALDRCIDLAASMSADPRDGSSLLCAAADTANLVSLAVARAGGFGVPAADAASSGSQNGTPRREKP